MFMTMCTATTNQNQQKNFSTEQLAYIRLSLEQAQLVPYLQIIEVTPEMLKKQQEKIRQAEESVKRPSWKLWKKYGGISYDFSHKRFKYEGFKRSWKTRDKEGEWLTKAVEWAIDNYPDLYEKECLECLKLGLKPWKGLILRWIHF